MKPKIKSLRDTLFDIFANEYMCDAQKAENLWAVREGVRRIDNVGLLWKVTTARKEHECIRGHIIKHGDAYCEHNMGGFGNNWKFCAGCMSMLLYFWKVEDLPAYMFTHWDWEQQCPVQIPEK